MGDGKQNLIWKRLKNGRTLSQILFFGLTVWIGARMVMGVRGATIERYCPFGGVETLIPWLNKTGTLCSLSTLNISILIAVLVMTFLFKRAFCSHICPLGALLEWIGLAGRRLVLKKRRIPHKIDWALTWIKYPLLAIILYFTVTHGELVFRDFDPYYVLFSAGTGHEIGRFGWWVTIGVLVAGFFLPLAFCKYLCPMGACLAPVCRVGIARVTRNADHCTNCGQCDSACQWGIQVSKMAVVKSAECSNCLDCIGHCPVPDALSLKIGRKGS